MQHPGSYSVHSSCLSPPLSPSLPVVGNRTGVRNPPPRTRTRAPSAPGKVSASAEDFVPHGSATHSPGRMHHQTHTKTRNTVQSQSLDRIPHPPLCGPACCHNVLLLAGVDAVGSKDIARASIWKSSQNKTQSTQNCLYKAHLLPQLLTSFHLSVTSASSWDKGRLKTFSLSCSVPVFSIWTADAGTASSPVADPGLSCGLRRRSRTATDCCSEVYMS